MGMAASQARYLGITARKINVEYEGQQVNQQRTALSNESAGLFRRLLSLEVPTAPSQSDYYTDTYTYSDEMSSDGKVTISSIEENAGSDPKTYTVITKYKETVPQYNCSTNQSVYVNNTSGGNKIYLSNGNNYDLSTEITDLAQNTVDEMNKTGNVAYTNETTDKYYMFTNSATKATYYINATKTGFDPTTAGSQTVDLFSIMPIEQEANQTITNATMGTSSSGLYNSISWTDESGASHYYTVSASQEYDEKAYNDAMEQYNVNKAQYDKEIADINAKTEELQETDRTLELRLKQLDTEQEALQTELDSVKKVIDKNVENVFKTFQ